jgi:uncharacterized membrane protein YeaQ/YmgE (transglycosylase-associated protein family)
LQVAARLRDRNGDAMFSMIVFVVLGVIVGIIAKGVLPGRDPGAGVTILLGTIAQIVAWLFGHALGWDRYGQPLQFFLSIGAAIVLLHVYRETGWDAALAERAADADRRAIAERVSRSDAAASTAPVLAAPAQSLGVRLALAPAWAIAGALMLGITGFLIGFFGPMRFQPWANQGPMVGIFVTGPLGILGGGLLGGALKIAKSDWNARRLLWTLNVVTLVYGLIVLELVADRRWWH